MKGHPYALPVGHETAEAEPIPDAPLPDDNGSADMARRIADEVAKGEVEAIGAVVLLKDGSIRTDWSATNHLFALIGGIDRLKYLMHTHYEEGNKNE